MPFIMKYVYTHISATLELIKYALYKCTHRIYCKTCVLFISYHIISIKNLSVRNIAVLFTYILFYIHIYLPR